LWYTLFVKFVFCSLGILPLIFFTPVSSMAAGFSDTTFSAYRSTIDVLQREGVLTGYSDGTFKPNASVNRAEFIAIVMRSISTTVPVVTSACFADVPVDSWYAPWVCSAKRRGIIQGYPTRELTRGESLELFKPEQEVRFAEAVKIIARLLDESLVETSGENWYQVYTQYLHDEGVLSQYSYIPWHIVNRERSADILHRFRELQNNKRIPRYSVGCGEDAPAAVPSSVTISGTARAITVRVPARYRTTTPVPVVFAFHGRTNSAQTVRSYYNFDRLWPEAIIVYPEGVQTDSGTYNWSNSGDTSSTLRDYVLFDETLRLLEQKYCIDTYHIYAAGHSLGGWFSNSLGCKRGDIVRATASVGSSGVSGVCNGPSAALLIHNPDDNLAPIASGEVARNVRLEANSCSYAFTPTEPRSLLCSQSTCDVPGNPVIWCPHTQDTDYRGDYYPHNWPVGASTAIVTFFKNLP
jgi:polyhydroxybutyrate depolymerase